MKLSIKTFTNVPVLHVCSTFDMHILYLLYVCIVEMQEIITSIVSTEFAKTLRQQIIENVTVGTDQEIDTSSPLQTFSKLTPQISRPKFDPTQTSNIFYKKHLNFLSNLLKLPNV